MEGMSYLRPPGGRARATAGSRTDGADAQVIPFPVRRPRATGRAAGPGRLIASRRSVAPEECMAELVAMLAEDGADVVAFARAVPMRFRGRLPAELRRAAGLAIPAEGW